MALLDHETIIKRPRFGIYSLGHASIAIGSLIALHMGGSWLAGLIKEKTKSNILALLPRAVATYLILYLLMGFVAGAV